MVTHLNILVRLYSCNYNIPLKLDGIPAETFGEGIVNKKSSPVTGLDRSRGFQEVKVPRFRDNGTGWW